ncbi:hypothetical protein [Brucella rhizosphaerae]|uniref:hypothetical protein n=1 Tax=Brucella rhizosphaerae TaxID=571254 RepID=UPI000561B1DA|nr:hypothetical protein [Brucella rhizosphaerae]
MNAPPVCPDLSERVWRTESRYLFAKQRAPFGISADESIHIEFMAGRGCIYSATVELIPSDYAREMAKAVTDAVESVNERWGLPRSSLDNSFTGMSAPVNSETGKDNV